MVKKKEPLCQTHRLLQSLHQHTGLWVSCVVLVSALKSTLWQNTESSEGKERKNFPQSQVLMDKEVSWHEMDYQEKENNILLPVHRSHVVKLRPGKMNRQAVILFTFWQRDDTFVRNLQENENTYWKLYLMRNSRHNFSWGRKLVKD